MPVFPISLVHKWKHYVGTIATHILYFSHRVKIYSWTSNIFLEYYEVIDWILSLSLAGYLLFHTSENYSFTTIFFSVSDYYFYINHLFGEACGVEARILNIKNSIGTLLLWTEMCVFYKCNNRAYCFCTLLIQTILIRKMKT